MKHRIAIALAATVLSAVALAGCGSNDNPEPEPTPSTNQTTTAVVEPFSTIAHIAQNERAAVSRIIDKGKVIGADKPAILAALVAARSEGNWQFHHSGPARRNIFGWSQQWDSRPNVDDAAIDDAINNFYGGANKPANLEKRDDVVAYAVAVQLTDDFSGREYFTDKTAYGQVNSSFSTEDRVRVKYTESLPYAQAAYDQLGG